MESDNQGLIQRNRAAEENETNQVVLENVLWLPPQTRQAARAMAILLFFSVLMFTIPFLVFFGTKHFVLEHFELSIFQCNAIAVFAAVVSVNIIIAIYAYIAYKEPEYDDQGNLREESQSGSKEQLEIKKD